MYPREKKIVTSFFALSDSISCMQKLVSEVFDFFVVIHACPSISADTRSPSSVRPHGSSAQTSGCSVEGEKMMLLKMSWSLCLFRQSFE